MESFKIGFLSLIFHELGKLSELKYKEITQYILFIIIFLQKRIFSQNLQNFSGTKISDYTAYTSLRMTYKYRCTPPVLVSLYNTENNRGFEYFPYGY